MKQSGDRVNARDRLIGKKHPPRRHGGAEERNQIVTTETRRRGESEVRENPIDGKATCDDSVTCNHQITRSLYPCHPERGGASATARRRIPVLPPAKVAAPGSSLETVSYESMLRLRRRLAAIWNTLVATLREIFDESAYERFLLRRQTTRSVTSYREFLREREDETGRRARCC